MKDASLFGDRFPRFPKCCVSSSSIKVRRKCWHPISIFHSWFPKSLVLNHYLIILTLCSLIHTLDFEWAAHPLRPCKDLSGPCNCHRGLITTPQNKTPCSIKIVEEDYIDASHIPCAPRQVSVLFCSTQQQTDHPHPLLQRATSPITSSPDLLFSPLLSTM